MPSLLIELCSNSEICSLISLIDNLPSFGSSLTNTDLTDSKNAASILSLYVALLLHKDNAFFNKVAYLMYSFFVSSSFGFCR